MNKERYLRLCKIKRELDLTSTSLYKVMKEERADLVLRKAGPETEKMIETAESLNLLVKKVESTLTKLSKTMAIWENRKEDQKGKNISQVN